MRIVSEEVRDLAAFPLACGVGPEDSLDASPGHPVETAPAGPAVGVAGLARRRCCRSGLVAAPCLGVGILHQTDDVDVRTTQTRVGGLVTSSRHRARLALEQHRWRDRGRGCDGG